MSLLEFAFLVLVIAAALVAWVAMRAGRRAKPVTADRIDTLIGWPPQATRVLTLAERQAFSTLRRAFPDRIILAQVPLSRFLAVPKRNSYADWLRRLGYQCADFVVCDESAQVMAVVELLGPPGPNSDRARRRLDRMARSLKAAKVALHIWTEGRLPTADAAREAIMPPPPPLVAAEAATSAADAGPPAPPAPRAARQPSPFDDSGRDSTQDEHIEFLEPPPSTWFDDIDSGPTPLRKP